ncbi:MAG: N-acetylmuramoyl-L-alanine amidase [Flammeovirgaceae bacterium]|jgi:N-acetyl-anhydromuramyl-L-alanine amidase AmpD|nr:N-acetylmuramoyl-L-alanine amidase [Flammeovirgaceae bacterium]|tara:strand:+ start:6031 stop:6660 length:630 start_codon:yes stop_codon:yes gene_type:complete
MIKITFFLWISLLYRGDQIGHKIIDRPISFDQQRIELSLDYLRDRYGLVQSEPTIVPKMVVVHWTAIPTLEATFNVFDPPTLPGARLEIQSAGSLNVSSQFLIDTDGTIYRLMPETMMARHVIGLNHCAIGIENVGPNEVGELTASQLTANVSLINYLRKKYSIAYVIGHYEYDDFIGHPLWLEKDANYRTEKVDPGEKFMKLLREKLD